MSLFLENARDILRVADSAAVEDSAELTILIAADGALRLVSGSEWSPAALQSRHSSAMAYRVTRRNGSVRVEGWSESERCLLEARNPARVASDLLPDRPFYAMAPAAQNLFPCSELTLVSCQQPCSY